MSPDLSAARRLLAAGIKLVPLQRLTKRPTEPAWNKPDHFAAAIDPHATGYGIPLAANGLCSIDPDQVDLARTALAAVGFDLDQLLAAGVQTTSTRPGSGGRSAFADPGDVRWLKLVLLPMGVNTTVFELRAASPNLQDVVPGLVYTLKDGTECTQRYVNGRDHSAAPALPPAFREWWRRCSADHAFWMEQKRLMAAACGCPMVAHECDRTDNVLPFASPARGRFNREHSVEDILIEHGYVQAESGRWAPPSATGAAGVRPIPGKEDLWHSDHASDPLHGTFDAWAAHVLLAHGGDLAKAEAAATDTRAQEMFAAEPVPEEPGFDEDIDDENFEPVPHLIDAVLPDESMTMLWGNSGSYKSFLALDWALHVRYGMDWHKRKVNKGNVLYLLGEGRAGFAKRVIAWRRFHGITERVSPGFRVNRIDDAIPFDTAPPRKLRQRYSLIVIDTLNRWSGGDENDATEMAAWLRKVQRFALQCGNAAVLIVHHAKKDGSMYRGSTALKAAMDAEFEAVVEERPNLKLRHLKSKDDLMLDDLVLRLVSVDLGMKRDKYGHERRHSSLVMRQSTEQEQAMADESSVLRVKRAIMLLESRNKKASKNAIYELVGGKKIDRLKQIDALVDRGVLRHADGAYSIAPGHTVFPNEEEALFE